MFKCSVSRDTECSRVGKQSFIITLGCNSVLLQFGTPNGAEKPPKKPHGIALGSPNNPPAPPLFSTRFLLFLQHPEELPGPQHGALGVQRAHGGVLGRAVFPGGGFLILGEGKFLVLGGSIPIPGGVFPGSQRVRVSGSSTGTCPSSRT